MNDETVLGPVQGHLPGLIDLSRLPSIAPSQAIAPGDIRAKGDLTPILEDLNAEQKQAVVHEGTPLLIMAGAGSGKTRVLTRRIAYLLATGQARHSSILAITFTNKAAAEMKQRVEALVGPAAKWMWVSTFHSACVRILRREAATLGLKSSFTIYDAQDSQRLITTLLDDLDINKENFKVKWLANRISKLKNELIAPDDFASTMRQSNPADQATARVYQAYQERLQRSHALDFDDLIMQTVNLLEAFPQVAQSYHQRFSHILVDEYQDTNHAQYLLVRALAGVRAGSQSGDKVVPAQLTVVGDQDQSIYAFRGATLRNITQFTADYPDATTILLQQNYRSTQNILDAANGVIAKGKDRVAKQLWTAQGDGPKVVGYVAQSEHDEAEYVAKTIDALSDAEGIVPADVAIFYRTNAQSRALEEVLVRVGLPYKVIGGTRFYERREVRDALAYMRTAANLDDTVSVRRIFNLPKRGLGAKSEVAVQAYAQARQISFGAALSQAGEITGLTPRAVRAIEALANLLANLGQMSQEGAGPAKILEHALKESGYLAWLQESADPQETARVENLNELFTVATEFERGVEDGTLADFLERVALVADADQLDSGEADSADGRPQGQVTLMTVHTAKGLEFPVVFATGLEQGTFPHARSFGQDSEMEEERRLAYVALTRARERLYLTRAESRTTWGAQTALGPSQFLGDIPPQAIDWQSLGSGAAAQRATVGSTWPSAGFRREPSWPARTGERSEAKPVFGSATPRPARDIPDLSVGDMVTHDTYGLGTVLEVTPTRDQPLAVIDFGDTGVKRILLRFAPVTKL
ncbi:MAG: DNA helicase PcrA [Micrococcales bacterium]|nr:DNA helicase PcrA [Micrococcales bacterium]